MVKTSKVSAPVTQYVIDEKKANNASIVMSSFKISQDELILALEELNDKIITYEILDKITNILPQNDDETKKLN